MKFCKQPLSRVKSIIPSSRLLFLLFLGLIGTVAGAGWGWGWLFFGLSNGLIAGLVAIDAWMLSQMPPFTARRKTDFLFELEEDNSVTLHLETSVPVTVRTWVRDDYPQGFQVSARTLEVNWEDETKKTVLYHARPHRRGRHRFQDIHLRVESKWKLLIWQQTISAPLEVKVYPRLESVRRVRKGLYRRQSMAEGSPVARAFGDGREFSHIREYLPDDDPRNINWMGTARQGKLVSNVFQPEVGQQVAILIDCGRMMGVQNDGQSQLDRALEAALGYAAIALERGDRVSFLAFSNRVLRWVPLGKGMSHLQRIIEASFDLDAGYVESDYLQVWDFIGSSHRSKTLITLFTDAANLAFSETMPSFIARAKKKHLVMTVSMQDPRLKRLGTLPLQSEEAVYQSLVVKQLHEERKQALQQWGSKKVVALDVEPDKLASAVIHSYLQIRNRANQG
ncbi:DUF58 domain-containing protein [Lihuaxuella thermophila]|nr:DUF58 domain-containing protein [Lihuaxuella thermophila]